MGGVVTELSLPLVGVVISVVGFVAMGFGAWLLVSGRPGHGHHAAGEGSAVSSWRTRMAKLFQARFDGRGQ